MRKLFIDINVLLDVLLAREPHLKASQKILTCIEKKDAAGYISAVTCVIIYYLIQKESNHKKAISAIRDLLKLVSIVETNKETIERALELEARDFEDNIQIACAELCKADYIITRNIADYRHSPVSALMPAEYLATVNVHSTL